jgi:hypothetical protein
MIKLCSVRKKMSNSEILCPVPSALAAASLPSGRVPQPFKVTMYQRRSRCAFTVAYAWVKTSG